jgi:hypothetical protein
MADHGSSGSELLPHITVFNLLMTAVLGSPVWELLLCITVFHAF